MTIMTRLKSNYHVSNLNLANINAARTIPIQMSSYDFTFSNVNDYALFTVPY